jgi:hypothetical protein
MSPDRRTIPRSLSRVFPGHSPNRLDGERGPVSYSRRCTLQKVLTSPRYHLDSYPVAKVKIPTEKETHRCEGQPARQLGGW